MPNRTKARPKAGHHPEHEAGGGAARVVAGPPDPSSETMGPAAAVVDESPLHERVWKGIGDAYYAIFPPNIRALVRAGDPMAIIGAAPADDLSLPANLAKLARSESTSAQYSPPSPRTASPTHSETGATDTEDRDRARGNRQQQQESGEEDGLHEAIRLSGELRTHRNFVNVTLVGLACSFIFQFVQPFPMKCVHLHARKDRVRSWPHIIPLSVQRRKSCARAQRTWRTCRAPGPHAHVNIPVQLQGTQQHAHPRSHMRVQIHCALRGFLYLLYTHTHTPHAHPPTHSWMSRAVVVILTSALGLYRVGRITPMTGATCTILTIMSISALSSATGGGMASPYSTAPPAGIMQV